MKQSLQLRMGQQLAMTPQLQQAIKLLQMSSLDLQEEIQQVLDSNMMLEVADEETPASAPLSGEENFSAVASSASSTEFRELDDMDAPADIPRELPLDVSWDEFYDTPPTSENFGSFPWAGGEDFMGLQAQTQSLHEALGWQLELTSMSERDHAIATTLIDSINEDGYLTNTPEEIHLSLMSQLPGLDLDEIKAVLHRIQNFEPPGVAAVDLAECLCIQLNQLPPDTPWRQEALHLVSQHLMLLAKKDITTLKRKLNLEEDSLNAVVSLIRKLDPKPGQRINAVNAQYITPDVFVSRQEDRWIVSLNSEIAPRLRVNPAYSSMVKRADPSPSNKAMKHHLQEARWFIKSLHSRNETLMRVATAIVERQQAFLDQGETAMKPLVLRDIATELDMHESTISRVTTRKYMRTPNGIYEFKHFFSSHVSTQGGGECSATAIKAYIKEIVEGENPRKPLSDETIARQLQDRGINVARRTIAKYREALSIPSSSERKQVF